LLFFLSSLPWTAALAQDRFKTMPGAERFQRLSRESTNAVKLGSLSVTWKDEGKSFEYQKDGKRFRYDIANRIAVELGLVRTNSPPRDSQAKPGQERREAGRSGKPARGRQFASATSPDGKYKAFTRDRNLWLSNTIGSNEVALTTDGSEKARIKYGTASWVYGEELFQDTAMWW